MMESKEIYFRVNRKDICYVKFIIEACSGVGSVTTIDAGSGRVVWRIAPGREIEARMILDSLKKELMLET